MKLEFLSYVRLAVAMTTCLSGMTTLLPAQTAPTAPPTAPPSAAAANDIRDIRGIKAVPSSEIWMMEAAGVAALAALAYGAYCWYRRVKLTPKTAEDIALERLEKALRLMQPDTAREFSIEVSETVRSYIEARFKVHATHQTTEEFLHGLVDPSASLLARHQELLGDFLTHCDLAKFARWVLSVEEMQSMHASARTFVQETSRAAESPTKGSAAPASSTTTLQPLAS